MIEAINEGQSLIEIVLRFFAFGIDGVMLTTDRCEGEIGRSLGGFFVLCRYTDAANCGKEQTCRNHSHYRPRLNRAAEKARSSPQGLKPIDSPALCRS